MSEWTGTRLAPNGGAPPPGNPFAPARTSTPSDPSLDAVVSRARELLKDAGTAPTYLAIKRELERVLDASAHPAAGGLSGGAGEFGTEAATAAKDAVRLLCADSVPDSMRAEAVAAAASRFSTMPRGAGRGAHRAPVRRPMRR